MAMDRKIEKKKGIRPKHIAYAVGTLVFIFLIVKLIMSSGVSSLKVDPGKITIEEVAQGNFDDYVRTNGTVQPISTIYLDAEEGGQVKERLIEEGAMVKKGDVILVLENRTLYENIMNSESNLAQKQNMLRQTRINFETQRIESKRNLLNSEYEIIKKKRNFEQQKALYDDELVSKENFLQAKEDYGYALQMQEINRQKADNDSMIRASEMIQLEQDLRKMQLTLDLVYERLDNLNVKAPVDGQLGMLDAEIGQSIGKGQRIGQINVLTDYKVEAMIDEHYIDRVKRNLSATIERQGKIFNMVVKKVYPEVRNSQFKIDLVFSGERPDNIRTGQTYYINLQLGQPEQSTLVSLGGFFNSTGGQWIYVVDPSGSFATKRSIRIGRKNPKYYEVLEGLEPGEKVITSGYDLFGDNDKLILK
ncbi:HlyD family efflux transporter periplasmic adaptor subunit [Maribellus sp. YY47]|uniref:efflux RND transporter periplasmic adaptor subunit n=1 Tax=Maribellus sp. YY47 TaxID=2929486 RepID=UPI002001CAFA|nr:HlyD family efflux transporter periplasmic adaptor subunit [Maribellus sp. YY47]MCK3682913.1 HlyD family efflux transporter periplasmic adaptor subunit [Maribellus sp. YY47]